MAKKTYREIVVFFNVGSARAAKLKAETKFRYALRKALKEAETLIGEWQEKRADLDVEHAATDEATHVILTDAQGRKSFTKDGERARNKALAALFETAVPVKGYQAAEVPDDLAENELEIYAGFVLPELTVTDDAAKPLREAKRG